MRKKLLGITVLTAALTLATGITSFAAGWVQDSNGWGWQRDDGSWQGMGWFTDPNTGYQYYLDPDGYMMKETRVEGFWLDADGRKHEKTEEELKAEEEREKRIASKPSPARQQAAANQAAKAAKNATTAVTTTRLSYQAEMKTFMDSIFIDAIQEARKLENYTVSGDTTENNLETTYRFLSEGKGIFFTSSLGLSSRPTSLNYTPHAIEIVYNRNVLSNPDEANIFNEAYRKFIVAALGETEGNAVYNRVNAEEIGNGASFDQNGSTDTGNTYELTYRNGVINIKVTCSEADAAAAEAAEAAQESTQENTPAEEPAATSSVITAGQGAVQNPAADTAGADEEAQTEDTSSEEAAAETTGEAAAE